MSAKASSAAFDQCLTAELEAVRLFLLLLREEQEALQNGNLESLPGLAEKKMSMISGLDRLGRERQNLLGAAGIPLDAPAIAAWIRDGGNMKREKLWIDLTTLAAEARELNQVNGRLIALRQNMNSQALKALAAASGQAAGLYGPDGQHQAGGGGRNFGAA